MRYEIGARLRNYREAQNLSQKEFAKLIGVSNSRVSNWEQGINRPDVDILSKICEVLKVSPSDLLNIKISSNVDKKIAINEDIQQLIKQYSLLNDKDKDLIKKLINSLSEKNKLV